MSLAPEIISAYRSLWPLVSWAAAQRDESGAYAYNSRDIISAAAQIYRDAGSALSFAEASAIPTLFGIARRMDLAATKLFQADQLAAIDSSMIAEWPTAAPLDVQAAQPEYMAKAQFTYINALGEQATGWVTLTGITQLPSSVGNLRNRLMGAALTAYSRTPEEGGTPKTDAEVMDSFGGFTSIQLYAV